MFKTSPSYAYTGYCIGLAGNSKLVQSRFKTGMEIAFETHVLRLDMGNAQFVGETPIKVSAPKPD